MSKSAQKNRRKKQQQQTSKQQEVAGGRSQEQKDALSVATHLMGGASIEGGGDKEKRIKNIRKVFVYTYLVNQQVPTC